MLYQKKSEKELSRELFQSPTAEYRGAPFWAWNTELDKDELLWQIDQLKEMGFGGFHIHSRAGMATEYLGKEFMELVKACNDKAKQEKMLAWLYDEDRWPSGFAGGFVTKNPKYRRKSLFFTVNPIADAVDLQTGYEMGKPYLLACYDVCLHSDGTLKNYARIRDTATEISGTKWYVYVRADTPTGRYNNQTYVDTLSEEAIAEFIRITYGAYLEAVGEDFGGSIPAIFTDEPQFTGKKRLPSPFSTKDITLPYTTDFADTFYDKYHIDILEHLPELLWNLEDNVPSQIRYFYHDHVCERFTRAFADQCGKWCDEHGIYLTGHMMHEDSLQAQTNSLGEAMRAYRSFGLPGIDMLCNCINLSTAKQCQSAVHQYGREGMLSELYGVTGWDFDFRGHKFQGDWQAALGVTVRVPHLSWVAMKGSAKRDYPASISYQSSWYKEYPYIEDHFARLNTALTRGTPDVKVGYIHPVESYWLHYGGNSADLLQQIEDNFQSVTKWLLFGTVDFDYICESLLPAQYSATDDANLRVGEMEYSAIVVAGVETLRSTTVDILKEFQARGGKVIFMGDCPKYVDAALSDTVRPLYENATVVPFTSATLMDALQEVRDVSIIDERGVSTNNLIYQMRKDGEDIWLFVAHAVPTEYKSVDMPSQKLKITVKGKYIPTLYDTIRGEILPMKYDIVSGNTVIPRELFTSDSLLIKLKPLVGVDAENCSSAVATPVNRKLIYGVELKEKATYSLSEPNVLVLDMAECSEDGITFSPVEELLRIDVRLRNKYKFPMADGHDVQPWLIEEETIEHFLHLRFTFNSEVEVPCKLAYEEAAEVIFNGQNVPVTREGWFTDHKIYTMSMPCIQKGKNVLMVKVPFGKRVSLENFFLLGEFGVRVIGWESTVTALPEKLAFGSLTNQGFPFYGANVTYKISFALSATSDIAIRTEYYKGALVRVEMDGEDLGVAAFSPHRVFKNEVSAGTHTLELTLFGTRINCFGALHNCSSQSWIGPNFWYTKGADWSYEYEIKPMGIMKSPTLEIYGN